MADTKICAQCGQPFARNPKKQGPQHFGARIYCSIECRGKAQRKAIKEHNEYIINGRRVAKTCECGQPTTCIVWVIQYNGNGAPIHQYVECCADCRDMFLECDPGASLDKPPWPSKVQYEPRRPTCDYHAAAHMTWRIRT